MAEKQTFADFMGEMNRIIGNQRRPLYLIEHGHGEPGDQESYDQAYQEMLDLIANNCPYWGLYLLNNQENEYIQGLNITCE